MNTRYKVYSLKTKAIFNAIYQILILLVPLITTPYISRVLGPDNNGDYSYYYSIVSYFTLVATFGFVDFGTKKIAETRDNIYGKTIAFFEITICKFIFGLLSLFLYAILCFCFFYNNIIIVLSFSFYIVSIMIDPLFYFQGEEKFISICVRNILLKVVSTLLIFLLVREADDLLIYVLILSLSQIFSVLITLPIIRKKEFTKIKLADINLKKCIFNSFPYFIPTLASSLFTLLNQTLLGIAGVPSNQQGYFGQAIKIVNILCTIPSSLSIIMLSRISYLNAIGNKEEINKKIEKTMEAYWFVSLPIFIGLIAINDIFTTLFLGDDYSACISLIYIISPTIIFSPLNTLYGSLYYRPMNKIRIQTVTLFLASLLNIILTLSLIPFLGATGAAVGRIIAEFCQVPILMIFSKKHISVSMIFSKLVKPALSSIIMLCLILIVKYLLINFSNLNNLIILGIIISIGILVYFIVEFILRQEILISILAPIIRKIKKKG